MIIYCMKRTRRDSREGIIKIHNLRELMGGGESLHLSRIETRYKGCTHILHVRKYDERDKKICDALRSVSRSALKLKDVGRWVREGLSQGRADCPKNRTIVNPIWASGVSIVVKYPRKLGCDVPPHAFVDMVLELSVGSTVYSWRLGKNIDGIDSTAAQTIG